MRTKTTTIGKKPALDTKTLTTWHLLMIEEALTSYTPPGLSDLARAQYNELRKTIQQTVFCKVQLPNN